MCLGDGPMFHGYKCFNEGLINRYGDAFHLHTEYHCNGMIRFGNDGNGFHVCERLEDTLRYFDAMNQKIDMTEVHCYGKRDEYEDDYYGYYDMYAYEYMMIDKILTREEIVDYGLHLYDTRVKRFLSLYKLLPNEIILFQNQFQNSVDVLRTISYYQEGNQEAFLESDKKYVKSRKV